MVRRQGVVIATPTTLQALLAVLVAKCFPFSYGERTSRTHFLGTMITGIDLEYNSFFCFKAQPAIFCLLAVWRFLFTDGTNLIGHKVPFNRSRRTNHQVMDRNHDGATRQ